MNKTILLLPVLMLLATMLYAQQTQSPTKAKQKVVIKYKEYEEFDLGEMDLEGESGSPGDISIIPRFQKQFSNALPYRTNFYGEIRRAVETVR